MNLKVPKIDTRDTKQIYDRAIALARIYCPEWQPDEQGQDIGVALLKLFSRLTEIVIGQTNKIPEKHLLAFYDFIGLDYLPPSSAKAPLTFNLSQGSKEAFVPARTKIASSQDTTVIFETMEPLTVIACNIKSAYSLNPWGDGYTNHSPAINGCTEGFYIFGGDTHEKPMEHILYIADDAFDSQLPAEVTITFGSGEDFRGYFSVCADGVGTRINTDGGFPGVGLRKVLLPKTTVDGVESNWISFRPQAEFPILPTVTIPEVTVIACDISVSRIIPEAVLFNDTPADAKKGFYPFGEMPKQGDAFYIGCEGAFSKQGATITLSVNVRAGKANKGLQVVWEYWNGTGWAVLPGNITENFTNSGGKTVELGYPEGGITTTVINGISNRWIRARINSGNYGEPGRYEDIQVEEIVKPIAEKDREAVKTTLDEKGISTGYRYIPPSFNPPFITSLSIGYSYKDRRVQHCKTYNNFKYRTVTSWNFTPFQPIPEDAPTLYLGFEDSPKNKPVSLYLLLLPISYGDTIPKIKKQGYDTASHNISEKAAGIVWKYPKKPEGAGIAVTDEAKAEWAEFAVTDETDHFTKNGILKFIIPSDITEQTLFGENLYWIKAELKEGSWFEPPKLKGIFPNTVWAENAAVIKDELLGSSNGQNSQVFNFSSKPLLGKPIIEIRETGIPSKDELEEGSDALRIVKDNSGEVQEVWVKWHEAATFVHSNSLSRHYILDRINGKIMFGDGIRGMIPPALPNNILAKSYQSGGGKNGNQPHKVITGLKTTIPNIEGVINQDSSSGGKDLEAADNILKRAPYSIKSRDRAVTGEDFEWLAAEASPEVAKARCIIRDGKKIQVIIAPAYDNGSLYPEASLTDYVETYLKERAFIQVKDRIEVIAPEYKRIGVTLTVVPVSISESAIVRDRVEKRLKEFLDPIKGGTEGKGWDFGQDIFISEVAAVVEGVEGVDYITGLTINDQGISETSLVSIEDNELPRAGEITFNVIAQ